MYRGYIKLWRKLRDSPLWLSEPFTRGQAWVDLLMLTNFKPDEIRKRGIPVKVAPGQVGWAEESLASRWQWSRGKVRRFLAELSSKMVQQIEQQKSNVTSIISITNWEVYQGANTPNDTASETPNGHQTDTKRYSKKNDKNDKKEKNDKKPLPPRSPQGADLPEWIPEQLWKDYKEHRQKLRKPMTVKAEKLAIGTLEKLKDAGHDPERVIEQAIEKGWQGFFPLKGLQHGDQKTDSGYRNLLFDYDDEENNGDGQGDSG